jgi:hypothetical protein
VEEMVPTVELPPATPPTLQVTAELYAPVPVTVGVHCDVSPVCTEDGVQDTVTAVIVGAAGGLRVIVAVADCAGLVTLVAVSITVAVALIEEGAVYVTLDDVEALSAPAPEPMLQVTPAFVESLATVAVKAWVPLPLRDAVVGLILTEMEGGGGVVEPLFPPQPTSNAIAENPQETTQKLRREALEPNIGPPAIH